MTWTIWGERFKNSDFSGDPRVTQPFTLAENTKIKSLRTWFVIFNDPSFTELSMDIRADQGGVATETIYTFDKVWTLAEMLEVESYGLKEIYFDFDVPKVLKADTQYHLVPVVSGAAFTAGSHLSWVRGFPDPNTTHSVPLSIHQISNLPFYMSFIGDDR